MSTTAVGAPMAGSTTNVVSAERSRPIKVLLFSTLFPSSVRPVHGIFVQTRLKYLLCSGEVHVKVVAPVPWFPLRGERFGDWGKMAATPDCETLEGVEVHHPRYLLPPKVGMNVAPLTLALGARATVARLIEGGFDFDLIDAHYYYPDGVAAALLAKWFRKPFAVTARGTDLTLIPDYALPRRMIQWAERRAFASIGVSRSLMDILAGLGGRGDRMQVIRNGVDLERFKPIDRADARATLDLPLDARIMVSVGHLIERKGHHVAIEALVDLADWQLVIVGGGEERTRLGALAERIGVSGRVRFAGYQAQTTLATWYSAADILVLCSSREGWANVLLESLACGTPVVATRISGTPEVIQSPTAGILIDQRTGPALATAVRALQANYPDRADVRRYAEGFSWEAPTQDQLTLFRRMSGRPESEGVAVGTLQSSGAS